MSGDEFDSSIDALLSSLSRGDVNLAELSFETKSRYLLLAAEAGHSDCTRLLLNAGAPAYASDSNGRTALHRAVLSGSVETVEALLAADESKVNAEDAEGNTPLQVAAAATSLSTTDVVRALIMNGALINQVNNRGLTPLHGAAISGNSAIVTLLLREGADLRAGTKDNLSALIRVIRRSPDALSAFLSRLDAAITLHSHQLDDVDCELRLDYRIFASNKDRGESELIRCLAKENLCEILDHPLCQSFLQLKWLKITTLSMINSAAYHTLFITYVFITVWSNNTVQRNIYFWILLFLTVIFASKEIFQIITYGKRVYFDEMQNVIRFRAVVTIGILLMNPTTKARFVSAPLASLLIWIDLFMGMSRCTELEDYVARTTMTLDVITLKPLVVLMWLFVGFDVGSTTFHEHVKSFGNDQLLMLYDMLPCVIVVTMIFHDALTFRQRVVPEPSVRRAKLIAQFKSLMFSKFINYAPKGIAKMCRSAALILPDDDAIYVRPNDHRWEDSWPRELVESMVRIVRTRQN